LLGILLVNKPLGLTSHDVVSVLRRKFETKRIGHAGTLDPLATGLLVMAIGPATRFLQYLNLEPKQYLATIEFGRATDTYDLEGTTTFEAPIPADLEVKLKSYVDQFIGLIDQIPPMFSAVKQGGQPLYKMARLGISVERPPRRVFVKAFDILRFEGTHLQAKIECSGGTYVRSLAHDLGEKVGCGALLAKLERVQVGRFRLEDASELEAVSLADFIPLRDALYPIPFITLDQKSAHKVCEGQTILDSTAIFGENSKIALLGPDGRLLGIGRHEQTLLYPECVLPKEVIGAF